MSDLPQSLALFIRLSRMLCGIFLHNVSMRRNRR
jgi:hypothetical protein